MAVTLEQLHLATQYPYGPPHESFLFVSGEAHIITDSGVDPLVGAVVRVGG